MPYTFYLYIMFYLVKVPWIVQKIYGNCVWKIPTKEKIIYLTFDDGPHPEATPFVLEQLKNYNAKATFFCIGKNVKAHPGIYERIIEDGHAVGNHTYDHLNGWRTGNSEYLDNVYDAAKLIRTNLFRPPYGRIKRFQVKELMGAGYELKTIMWTVLSGDFDTEIKGHECYHTVIKNAEAGSIVVFHDSEKALPRLSHALPLVLKYFSEKGYEFRSIDERELKN